MPTRFAFVLGAIHLAFVLTSSSHGEAPPAPNRPPRSDRYGDPLPSGVVARLGTERLTLGNAVFLTFSPDGRRVASHNGREDLRVWDVASGKELLRVKTPAFRGFGAGMEPLSFSSDSKAIAMACPAETMPSGKELASVRVWEIANGKERHRFDGLTRQAIRLAFSPEGRYLFASAGSLLRWDLKKGGAAKEYSRFSAIGFLAISRDGKTLTAAAYDKQDSGKHILVRWDVATGKEIGRHAIAMTGGWSGALSPEGSIFAHPEADVKSIVLTDPSTGRALRRIGESDYPGQISFSADGTTMACTSKDGVLRVWDTATGKPRTRFKTWAKQVNWTALSPEGKRLAFLVRADYAVHLWDVAAGRELHSFAGHRGYPLSLAFLKGGKEIATVSRDSFYPSPPIIWSDWSLRRWDAATALETAVTRADPKGAVVHTTFSPDGRRLATVIHNGTLRLWDVESGKVLRHWKVPTSQSLMIRNDGKGGQLGPQNALSSNHRTGVQPGWQKASGRSRLGDSSLGCGDREGVAGLRY